MKCQTCSHPQREAIDLALLTENHTFASLSEQYGLSVSSLFRHKKHLEENMIRARQRLQDAQDQVSLLKLNTALDSVQRAVQAAELAGNIDQVLKGAQVASRIIRQINQMEVPLGLDTVYRLISSPQFVTQDSLLPTGPEIITGIHQSLAEAAFLPCPEPGPELDADEEDADDDAAPDDAEAADDGEDAAEDSESPSLETKNLLRELLADLITAAGISPKTKREKSAKLPVKAPSMPLNNTQYQQDKQYEKILAKNSFSGPESETPAPGIQLRIQNPELGTTPPAAEQSGIKPGEPLETLNAAFDLPPDPVSNASCHGVRNVLSIDNPRRCRGTY